MKNSNISCQCQEQRRGFAKDSDNYYLHKNGYIHGRGFRAYNKNTKQYSIRLNEDGTSDFSNNASFRKDVKIGPSNNIVLSRTGSSSFKGLGTFQDLKVDNILRVEDKVVVSGPLGSDKITLNANGNANFKGTVNFESKIDSKRIFLDGTELFINDDGGIEATSHWQLVDGSESAIEYRDGSVNANQLNISNQILTPSIGVSETAFLKKALIGKDQTAFSEIVPETVLSIDGRTYISEEDSRYTDDNDTERGFVDSASENFEDFLLWVEKGIATIDIGFSLVSLWPDYVFDETYKLRSINELESEIKKLGHLPTMPSAEEIETNGFLATDMFKRTLTTVEELTLYTIDQEKKIEAQNNLINNLLDKVDKLTERLTNLETNKD